MELSRSDSTDTHPTHSTGRGCSETEFLEDLTVSSLPLPCQEPPSVHCVCPAPGPHFGLKPV